VPAVGVGERFGVHGIDVCGPAHQRMRSNRVKRTLGCPRPRDPDAVGVLAGRAGGEIQQVVMVVAGGDRGCPHAALAGGGVVCPDRQRGHGIAGLAPATGQPR